MFGEIGLVLLLVYSTSSVPSPHHKSHHGHHGHDHHNHGHSTTCDFTPGQGEPDCNIEACKDVKFARRDGNMRCNQYWQCASQPTEHHRSAMPAPKHHHGHHPDPKGKGHHGHHPDPKGKGHHGHNHNHYSGVANLHTCPSGQAFVESRSRCEGDYQNPYGQICGQDGIWGQGKDFFETPH